MKTPLGTEVDLGPDHIVLDGVPALRERGTTAPPPPFGPCLLWLRSPISATGELLLRCASGQTYRQTDRQAHSNTSHPYWGRNKMKPEIRFRIIHRLGVTSS